MRKKRSKLILQNLFRSRFGDPSDKEKTGNFLNGIEDKKVNNLDASLQKLEDGLSSIKREIDSEVEKTDWNTVSENVTGYIADSEKRREGKPLSKRVNLKPVLTAAAVVTAVASIFLVYSPWDGERTARYSVPAESVEKIERNLGRHETLDYLRRSKIFLANISDYEAGQLTPSMLKSDKELARHLLNKKRYLNHHFNNIELSKAKNICDQIEFMFYEIVMLEEERDPAHLQNIKDFIRDNRLMLKINLLEKELTDREV